MIQVKQIKAVTVWRKASVRITTRTPLLMTTEWLARGTKLALALDGKHLHI